MAEGRIVFLAVTVTPNPVYAGEEVKITADIQPIRDVIGDDGGRITDNDGACIEVPDK